MGRSHAGSCFFRRCTLGNILRNSSLLVSFSSPPHRGLQLLLCLSLLYSKAFSYFPTCFWTQSSRTHVLIVGKPRFRSGGVFHGAQQTSQATALKCCLPPGFLIFLSAGSLLLSELFPVLPNVRKHRVSACQVTRRSNTTGQISVTQYLKGLIHEEHYTERMVKF